MKNKFPLLAMVAMACSSCFTASIFTYVPEPQPVAVATSAPAPVQVVSSQPVATTTVYRSGSTTTVKVMSNEGWDMSYYLDLNAVGAAFAQSNNVREFEMLINNSQYMLTNLDLNGDGYVDYLRVMETYMGSTHVLLIQAVLGYEFYQDVATIVAECAPGRTYVQVIGSQYVYGKGYIIEPVFVKTPPMYAYWCQQSHYSCYVSPYAWEHYPTCYKRPKPVYISHYQAYVDNYMHNHSYCHEAKPVDHARCEEYGRMTQPYQRNDYATQYPERSFSSRTEKAIRGTSVVQGSSSPATSTSRTRVTQPVEETRPQQPSATTRMTEPSKSAQPSSARELTSPKVERQTVQTEQRVVTTQQRVDEADKMKRSAEGRSEKSNQSVPSVTTQTRVMSTGSSTTKTTRVDENGKTNVRMTRTGSSMR